MINYSEPIHIHYYMMDVTVVMKLLDLQEYTITIYKSMPTKSVQWSRLNIDAIVGGL